MLFNIKNTFLIQEKFDIEVFIVVSKNPYVLKNFTRENLYLDM